MVNQESVYSQKMSLPLCCIESFKFQLSKQNKKVLEASNVYTCHSCSKYIYKCANCKDIFRTQGGMHVHSYRAHSKNRINGVKEVLPECCNVSFYKHLSSDAIKIRDTTGNIIVCDGCFEYIYNCSACKETFRTKYRLNMHVLKEHGERKGRLSSVQMLFKCSFCLHTFSKQHLLDSHIRHRHRLVCQMCCEIFKTKIELTKHVVSVHTSNCVVEQTCKKPAFLPNRSPLRLERPFSSKSNMCRQKKGTFQCSKCSMMCGSYELLWQHIRDVHSTRRWLCAECRGVFESEITLNDHIVDIHSPVPGSNVLRRCNVCKRTFDSRRSIWEHVTMKGCNLARGNIRLQDKGAVKAESNPDDVTKTNSSAQIKIIKTEQVVDEDNCEEEQVIGVNPLKIKEEVDDMDIGPEVLQYPDHCYSNCVEECAN